MKYFQFGVSLISYNFTAWKVSKYGVISGPYFPVFSPNSGQYGREITPYLDTFHAVTWNTLRLNSLRVYFITVVLVEMKFDCGWWNFMESPPRNEIIRKETHLRIQIFHQNKDDSKGYVLFESLLCLWNCKQKYLTLKKENTVHTFQCFQLKLITKSYLDEDS